MAPLGPPRLIETAASEMSGKKVPAEPTAAASVGSPMKQIFAEPREAEQIL